MKDDAFIQYITSNPMTTVMVHITMAVKMVSGLFMDEEAELPRRLVGRYGSVICALVD